MSKYFYRIFTIIDLHIGAMQPCSSGLGMTLEASDFSIRPKIGRLLYVFRRRSVGPLDAHVKVTHYHNVTIAHLIGL